MRIEKAFPNRSYFLDLDRDYDLRNSESPSKIELKQLFEAENSYDNWIQFISQYEHAHPCLQYREQSQRELETQIDKIQSLGKQFCVRLELTRLPDNLETIVNSLNRVGTSDYVLLIEGGWVTNALLAEAQIQGIIDNELANIDANVSLVISCTSIPKGYSEIEGIESIAFTNRDLLTSLSLHLNRRSLIYGDWGSTRPREFRGGGSPPLPRVDYPTKNSWLIARNKDDGWDFKDASKAIVDSQVWADENGLGVWGEQMIQNTSVNPSIGINSPHKNVASRVNLHLHRQAFFDVGDIRGLNLDEDWID